MKKEKKYVKHYVNYGTDDQMELYGYVVSIPAKIIVYIFMILTIGFLRLVFYWKPHWMLMSTHKQSILNEATKVLLKDKYQQYFVENVCILKKLKKNDLINSQINTENEPLISYSDVKYFVNKRWKYIWNDNEQKFQRLKGLDENLSIDLLQNLKGFNKNEQDNLRELYGENSIRIHLTPIYKLLLREVLSPFYIFQVCSCILLFTDNYIFYAICIIVLSIISIVYALFSIRRNERALRDITHKSSKCNVLRYNSNQDEQVEEEILSDNLVPGDIIVVKNMSIMHCDALILNGNVIVNESMLTGESVPITKTGLINSALSNECKIEIKEHNKHILFCGTQIIQTRYYENEKIKAVVLRSGFNTIKGELIRSILHPKPVDFRFNIDTYKYIAGLALIAFSGMIFAITIKVIKSNPYDEIIRRSLDLIAIAVPPALPGLLTAGLIYAQNRLRTKKIFSISPRTINICGSLNTFVFDKTGTLTEDGLDMKCVLPTKELDENNVFDKEFNSVDEFMSSKNVMLEAMASCHSLTHINGELAGDPLDLKMFLFTNWALVEPINNENKTFQILAPTIVYPKTEKNTENDVENSSYQIGIIRQFPFSSSLQRMSVIVRGLNRDNFDLFCKGSPEKIIEMSKSDTIPKDFQQVLTNYTGDGYRVIGIAKKQLNLTYAKLQRIEREKLECDLEFLGLIILENRLKKQTTPIIKMLKAANIRTIMCTGDNILTALSVARDCDLINMNEKIIVVDANHNEEPMFSYADIIKQKVKEIEFDPKEDTICEKDKNARFQFALSGKTFTVLRNEHKELLEKIAVRGAVFARMSPEQKQQLIELLQELGYFVGMCGDGANDCGALKAANAGISLSDAEASVASPFTSKTPNIECVPILIQEGRAALVTSFGLVRLICLYSVTQFLSVIILYSINAGLTDMEFLYVDIIITIISLFFGRTKAYKHLNKKPPLNKLVAFRPIASFLGHTLLTLFFQLFIFFYTKYQPWFEAYEDSEDKKFASYENTAVFYISIFQILTLSIIFSKGAPYRESILTNYIFLVSIILGGILNGLLILLPINWLIKFFAIRPIPDIKFKLIIIGIGLIHFFIAFLFETYVIENEFETNFNIKDINQYEDKKLGLKKRLPHQKIEHEIRKNKQWPPIKYNFI